MTRAMPSRRALGAPTRSLALGIAMTCAPTPACAQPVPIADRLYAEPGTTLVVPVRFEGSWTPFDPIAAWTDTGQNLPADVYRVVLTPQVPEPSRPPLSRWLGPRRSWSSVHNDRLRRGAIPRGFWAVVIELPNSPEGSTLRIGPTVVPMVWIEPQPGQRARASEHNKDRANPGARSGVLDAAAALLADQPDRRWRAGLIRDELGLTDPTREEAYRDAVVESYAQQTEARWAAALAALDDLNPDLARRVEQRLIATVRFAPGVEAPAWPDGSRPLDELIDIALAPGRDAAWRIAAARRWLAQHPPSRSWVIDDAGLWREGPGGDPIPVGRVGIANLSDEAAAVSVLDAHSGRVMGDPDALPGWSALEVEVEPGSEHQGVVTSRATIGREHHDLAMVLTPLPARPPGVPIGPLTPEWTMRSWLGSDDDSPTGIKPMTIGVLRPRAALELGSDPAMHEDEHRSTWSIYLESRVSGDSALDDREHGSLRIWLGRTGHPSHVIRVSPSGRAVDERTGRVIQGVLVAHETERWACDIPLPDDALDPDGILRIAVEWIGADAARWSWPRAVLPWQDEPGRIAIDTDQWHASEN